MNRIKKCLLYFPPEFYSLAICAGCFKYTGALSPDMAMGMSVVAVSTSLLRKIY